MTSQMEWIWGRRAVLLLAAALVVPACGVGGGGGNLTGSVGSPIWNSTSTQSTAPSPTGLVWNPVGSVIIPGQNLTGLDVTYSAADPVLYPNQNIPTAKPPIVQSPYYLEPVTTSGQFDPQGYEDAVNQMVAAQFLVAYPGNAGGGFLGGVGAGGGVAVPQQPSLTFADPRCSATARGTAFTMRDMGALPKGATLMWRLGVSGGTVASVIKAQETAIDKFALATKTPAQAATQLQTGVAAYIGKYGTGTAIYQGAGFASDLAGTTGWIHMIIVVASANPPF